MRGLHYAQNISMKSAKVEALKVGTAYGVYRTGVALANSQSPLLQTAGRLLSTTAKVGGAAIGVVAGTATAVGTGADLGARALCGLYTPIQMANNPFAIAQ